ncbi:hypothetical protein [Sphingomonas jatrophae]|uniref:Helix-hairpin-helix motif-containing protein n=1 Tax=Sphingomonas jatrophae TaxID=1166337 RepID=A0A1I6LLJ5_9SPHN|nr:hypothetical protein [Sphingomonas jatrophae]SFS04132.1 hypothetical protein SAMN05192580_2882 [Sphingomonas jatrophae]
MRRHVQHGRVGLAFIGLLAVTACATPSTEDRVRSELLRAGVQPRMAGCMAERLSDRLSIMQLRKLGRAAQITQRRVGAMTVDELIGRVRGIGDPEIVEVVTRAGVGCFIAG